MLKNIYKKSRIGQKTLTRSLWNIKKELFPHSRDPPTAMIDPESGNLITDAEKIQDVAVATYTKRLKNKV